MRRPPRRTFGRRGRRQRHAALPVDCLVAGVLGGGRRRATNDQLAAGTLLVTRPPRKPSRCSRPGRRFTGDLSGSVPHCPCVELDPKPKPSCRSRPCAAKLTLKWPSQGISVWAENIQLRGANNESRIEQRSGELGVDIHWRAQIHDWDQATPRSGHNELGSLTATSQPLAMRRSKRPRENRPPQHTAEGLNGLASQLLSSVTIRRWSVCRRTGGRS